MADHKHEDLRRVFDLAIALPAGERDELLERECRGDEGLKKRIEAMVAAAEDDRFLGTPTTDPGAVLEDEFATIDTPTPSSGAARLAESMREVPGTRIGPYKILQLIGEGGFGSVYMAEQEKPVSRRVALKIIKLGMDTGQVVARFEQERQALAIMDHPNIAKVFDAGATETGRPYFAMELCKGEPISEYCDKHNLSIGARLELFAQVCRAVQHAHTKGIIHRDIKPTNVLVSTQDGRPSAKVIDFGIAKATASKLTEKTLFTEHRQLIGTPEYMSPEQAEGSLDIDTRTDVYSLGVVLYELLTGSTPFSGKDLRSAAYGEIQRIIREVDPPRPSTRLSQNAETLANVAARRQTEPRRLGSVLRGELDWIVMKALEKDRARRYESANGLAEDIRRYLGGEAVVAAPPSTGYRFRKFVGRNRGPVIAAGAVAAALLVGVVGFAWQAQRAKRAEGVARARLAESEETVKFLDDMLGSVDPSAMGKDVTVRAVLDEAAKAMGGKFADRPLVEARLHGTIGRTYLGLAMYPVAGTHVREALAIRRRVLGPDHEDTCRALNDLGALLIKNGAHAEAEALFKQAIVDHERLFGRRHAITLASIDGLGVLYETQNRAAEGIDLIKESFEGRSATLGKEHPDTLATMNALATAYADLGKFDEAERLFDTGVETLNRVLGKDHPGTLQLRANQAWMLYWAGTEGEAGNAAVSERRMKRAMTLGEEVVEARKRVLGEEHHETMSSMSNLASVYMKLGMMDKAEALKRKDLEVSLRTLGEEHPDTIVSLSNVGNMLRQQKRYEEAVPMLERAVRLSKKVLPPGNPGTAFALGGLGTCLKELGRFSEAEPLMLEGRAIVGKAMGEDHPIAKQMSSGLQMLYEAWEKAEPGKGYEAKAAEWKGKNGKVDGGRE